MIRDKIRTKKIKFDPMICKIKLEYLLSVSGESQTQ